MVSRSPSAGSSGERDAPATEGVAEVVGSGQKDVPAMEGVAEVVGSGEKDDTGTDSLTLVFSLPQYTTSRNADSSHSQIPEIVSSLIPQFGHEDAVTITIRCHKVLYEPNHL